MLEMCCCTALQICLHCNRCQKMKGSTLQLQQWLLHPPPHQRQQPAHSNNMRRNSRGNSNSTKKTAAGKLGKQLSKLKTTCLLAPALREIPRLSMFSNQVQTLQAQPSRGLRHWMRAGGGLWKLINQPWTSKQQSLEKSSCSWSRNAGLRYGHHHHDTVTTEDTTTNNGHILQQHLAAALCSRHMPRLELPPATCGRWLGL